MANTAGMTPYLTSDEVAATLKVSKWTIYRAITDGKLSAARIGKQYRISAEQLQAYLDGQSNQVTKTDAVDRIVGALKQ